MRSYINNLFIVLIAFTLFFAPQLAFAHRSGCHRWHSCPSDTGSYICGDLGHPSYCGSAYSSSNKATLPPVVTPSIPPPPINTQEPASKVCSPHAVSTSKFLLDIPLASKEKLKHQTRTLYWALLDRPAENENVVEAKVNQYSFWGSLASWYIAEEIMRSPEFKQKNQLVFSKAGSNSPTDNQPILLFSEEHLENIRTLYRGLLKRDPESDVAAQTKARFDHRIRKVAEEIMASDEFESKWQYSLLYCYKF